MTALPDAVTKENFDNNIDDDPKLAFNELAANVDKHVAQRDFLNGLFGATGEKVATRTELGLKALAIRDTVAADQIESEAVTLAKMAKGGIGGLLIYDKAAQIAKQILPGAAGFAWVSNGPGEEPSYQEVTGIKVHNSSDYTFTDRQVLTVSHSSFGVSLDSMIYQLILTCQVDNIGYFAGDKVIVGTQDSSGASRSFSIMPISSTETKIQTPKNAIMLAHKLPGINADAAITNSSWKVRLRILGISV